MRTKTDIHAMLGLCHFSSSEHTGYRFGFNGQDHIMPGVLSFTKENGKIFFHSRTYFGPGDNYCIMWDFIDLLPKGENGWVPKYDH